MVLVGNGHFENAPYWKWPLWGTAFLKTAILEHGHFDTVMAILGTAILEMQFWERPLWHVKSC